MADETDGAASGGADRGPKGGSDGSGGWRASNSCLFLRGLGGGLLTVSVLSLAVAVAPVAVTVDVPVVDVVREQSIQAVTRGIVVGLVLTGNGRLADRIVAAGRAIRAAAARRSS